MPYGISLLIKDLFVFSLYPDYGLITFYRNIIKPSDAACQCITHLTTVIDGRTKKVIVANITVGNDPTGIVVNPISNKIYVTNYNSNTLSVIDGDTNAVVKTINVGDAREGADVNPSTVNCNRFIVM
jgi:YVTN family beta-propeller protein